MQIAESIELSIKKLVESSPEPKILQRRPLALKGYDAISCCRPYAE